VAKICPQCNFFASTHKKVKSGNIYISMDVHYLKCGSGDEHDGVVVLRGFEWRYFFICMFF
jgi:hypothetical protein